MEEDKGKDADGGGQGGNKDGCGCGCGAGPDPFPKGPGGSCVCPKCGKSVPHERGKPCFKIPCPDCGIFMIRVQ